MGAPPKSVQALWDELIRKHRNAGIGGNAHQAVAWKKIVFRLLAIADEASSGVGFMPSLAEGARTLTDVMARRTMIGLGPSAGIGADIAAARVAQAVLGWDSARVDAEVMDYRRWISRYRPRALEPVSVPD